jgi:hypothetical protein
MKGINLERNKRRRRLHYEDLQVLGLLYIGLLHCDHDHEVDWAKTKQLKSEWRKWVLT